ncbi:MAG: Fe2+-dependent dioxygenase [Alphaproteobacteria bacterium]|nr:Fe2+-dependent dioxygenase [Alphaproteobacteria bacterium]
MLLLDQVLSTGDLETILTRIAAVPIRDGGNTAGGRTAKAKNNREFALDHEGTEAVGTLVLNALRRNADFRAYVQPLKIRMPIISVYDPGMAYGDHLDAPVMGEGPIHTTRTDLSVTVFLSEPGSYDGGELILRAPTGERSVKLPAGGAVCYPTAYVHRVTPVTRGRRLAVVTWVQSRVRDHEERAILYDLTCAIHALPEDVDDGQRLRLNHVYTRLMQKWTEA